VFEASAPIFSPLPSNSGVAVKDQPTALGVTSEAVSLNDALILTVLHLDLELGHWDLSSG
jgi:hypothetical protein